MKRKIMLSSVLILFLSITNCRDSLAQTQSPVQSARASATATVKVPATKALIQLQISRTAPTAKEASEKNRAATNKVVQALKANEQIKALQTSSMQLYPTTRYDNQRNESIVTGYESRNALQFEVVLDIAGIIIDQAIENGANSLQSVTFAAEDSVTANARSQAVAEATKKAKAEAETSIQALGLTASGVQSISVESSNPMIGFQPSPRFLEGAALRQAAPSTELVGGDLSVSATVSVELRL